jgi:hypothetical protein
MRPGKSRVIYDDLNIAVEFSEYFIVFSQNFDCKEEDSPSLILRDIYGEKILN